MRVGDIVQYVPRDDVLVLSNGQGHEDPCAAIVTRVWSDRMVNLLVFRDAVSDIAVRTSVPAYDPAQTSGAYFRTLQDVDDQLV